MSFRYTEAIVCRLPECLPPATPGGGGDGGGNTDNVDLLKCRIEFENFVTVLRETGLVSKAAVQIVYLNCFPKLEL